MVFSESRKRPIDEERKNKIIDKLKCPSEKERIADRKAELGEIGRKLKAKKPE